MVWLSLLCFKSDQPSKLFFSYKVRGVYLIPVSVILKSWYKFMDKNCYNDTWGHPVSYRLLCQYLPFLYAVITIQLKGHPTNFFQTTYYTKQLWGLYIFLILIYWTGNQHTILSVLALGNLFVRSALWACCLQTIMKPQLLFTYPFNWLGCRPKGKNKPSSLLSADMNEANTSYFNCLANRPTNRQT